MKLYKKIMYALIISMIVLTIFQTSTVFAEGTFNWKTEIDNQAKSSGADNVMKPVNNISGAIITIARIICVGVAITMLIVLAMKYMMSAPGDRATIKKHAVVYIVGAIIMFACTGILGIIQNFAASI